MIRALLPIFAVIFVTEAADTRVVDGHNAEAYQFPSMSYLTNANTGQYVCGSVLVSSTYALTAAHCISSSFSTGDLVLVASTVKQSTMTELQGVSYEVMSATQHPYYNSNTKKYDVAWLKIDNKVIHRTSWEEPITISCNTVPEGELVTYAGWGYDNADQVTGTSTMLHYAENEVLSDTDCNSYLKWSKEEDMMCVGDTWIANDACPGDDGGPLFREINGIQYLVGIASQVGDCDPVRGVTVFTKMSDDIVNGFIQKNCDGCTFVGRCQRV